LCTKYGLYLCEQAGRKILKLGHRHYDDKKSKSVQILASFSLKLQVLQFIITNYRNIFDPYVFPISNVHLCAKGWKGGKYPASGRIIF